MPADSAVLEALPSESEAPFLTSTGVCADEAAAALAAKLLASPQLQRRRLQAGGGAYPEHDAPLPDELGRRRLTSDDPSNFVGDLAPDMTDEPLLGLFSPRFTSMRGAKVVMDLVTQVSKGFGFVRFGGEEEAD
ncbi:hypothetical protein PF005_g11537 [Phytophthora fragariae]|uniref:RRM domain-containing protein n=1 Tax=Phytophthora fragariae TaxID=53985 RepID=A0A6A3Y361_9STRA|nr:hypothetical protein PF003_g17599 [Phytophthora fragariae]KAE8936721.1 hypothetical protein PF009_g13352 [Phytophthora fragariae]KAE9001882.1 hypothetical protein PF011_g13551 [Phytophthora fragariae]KAE9092016.1 hypothetical protein PF007_g18675 [Phytophthora fragariae]KAE9210166.1 hypothetical protein PF005_g11537 [Phytophthora fragariae]